MRWTPARNSVGLAASRAGVRKGDGGGGHGLLIGAARDRNGRGFKELKRGVNPAGEVCAGVTAGA
jgi:hypothetical protein